MLLTLWNSFTCLARHKKNVSPWCASQFPLQATKLQSSRDDPLWLGFHGIYSMFSIHWMSKGFSSSSCKIPESQLCVMFPSPSSRGKNQIHSHFRKNLTSQLTRYNSVWKLIFKSIQANNHSDLIKKSKLGYLLLLRQTQSHALCQVICVHVGHWAQAGFKCKHKDLCCEHVISLTCEHPARPPQESREDRLTR